MPRVVVETAETWIPDGADLAATREAALGCKACPLWAPATQTVFGEGPADARWMLVGEVPGDKEDLAGHPFIGPAGSLLTECLEEAGLDRSTGYLTNAVKHFKYKQTGKRRMHDTPRQAEIVACRPWVAREIELVRPDVLVCLGATAAKSLIGKAFSVTAQRGQPVPSPLAPTVLATVHPSSLLRARQHQPDAWPEERARFVADLAVIRRALDAPT